LLFFLQPKNVMDSTKTPHLLWKYINGLLS
jgi:hypothetical protein